jgi:WD40 repeat protein
VLSNSKERRVSVTLGERPQIQAAHDRVAPCSCSTPAAIRRSSEALALTPMGKQLVYTSDDKIICDWDWQAGKSIRAIRRQVTPRSEGKIYAIALSPDGRWLTAGRFMAPGFGVQDDDVGIIRLYDFATGPVATSPI